LVSSAAQEDEEEINLFEITNQTQGLTQSQSGNEKYPDRLAPLIRYIQINSNRFKSAATDYYA
jgi:hypothetical protein